MNAVTQILHYFEALLNSPHHLMAYIATAAVLLISAPLLRLIFRSPRRDQLTPVEIAYPSMLGLSSLADLGTTTSYQSAPLSKNVMPINESLTVPCIHCRTTMSARQDFCPACGFAQPMKQIFTA